MQTHSIRLFLILFLAGCQMTGKMNDDHLSTDDVQATVESKPNIIYILADDLGYGEVGYNGQKIIETPHIDALAKTGKKFTQHYTGAPVCAPARCILLTGQHSGHAYIRGNDEMKIRGDVWSYEAMFRDSFLEGQRPLPANIVTIPKQLKKAGYQTGMVGKWGLGYPGSESTPNKQGFDFFYGYNCQRQAHTYYPMHLWENEKRVLLNNKMVAPHTRFEQGTDLNNPRNYDDYSLNDYAPDMMHQAALSFVDRNKKSPFFLYYASPIPHLALQAPKKWVDYYRTKLGPETPYDGRKGYFPCQYPRATYAGMISYLDEQVGELVAKLKELGLYENTLIIFTSDNGPSYTGGVDAQYFNSAHPFITADDRGKGYVYEGGIRVPTIASWPDHISPGTTTDHISGFYDVLPTLCDLVNVATPEGLDGTSFAPTLLEAREQKKPEYLYWEFPEYGGQQALRMGKWKAIKLNLHQGQGTLQLFDLSKDIKEETNVADQNPEVVDKIKSIFIQEHVESEFDRFKIGALGDEKTK